MNLFAFRAAEKITTVPRDVARLILRERYRVPGLLPALVFHGRVGIPQTLFIGGELRCDLETGADQFLKLVLNALGIRSAATDAQAAPAR